MLPLVHKMKRCVHIGHHQSAQWMLFAQQKKRKEIMMGSFSLLTFFLLSGCTFSHRSDTYPHFYLSHTIKSSYPNCFALIFKWYTHAREAGTHLFPCRERKKEKRKKQGFGTKYIPRIFSLSKLRLESKKLHQTKKAGLAPKHKNCQGTRQK